MKRLEIKQNKLGRRSFLQVAGMGGAALVSGVSVRVSDASPQVVRGNDRPTGAVIGLGNRGRGMAEWQMPPYADILAICDVDLRKTDAVAKEVLRRTNRKVDIYQDYRRVLDRKDIDIIANTTPEHWHTKLNIDACRAGKDVYCEKPLTLSIDEGKVLRRVLEETGRIIQVGTQQRSGPQFQIVCSLARSGRIGQLKKVAVILPGGGPQDGGGPATEEPVPKELNWDMWSGQAPLRPFSTSRLKGSSKWWDYGGGIVTNWGHHHMDIAHWGMGSEEVGPTSVEAEGYSPNFGKPGYPDQFLPFAAHLNYPNDVEMWFLSAYNAPSAAEKGAFGSEIERIYGKVPDQIKNYKTEDQDHGVLFIGTKGMIFVGRGRAAGEGIGELEQMPIPENGHMRWRSCLYAHMFNFVTCVRTRQKPISQAAEQHRTVIPCHLTNIALRLGRKLQWDPVREQFVGDDEANAMLSRSQRQPYSIQG